MERENRMSYFATARFDTQRTHIHGGTPVPDVFTTDKEHTAPWSRLARHHSAVVAFAFRASRGSSAGPHTNTTDGSINHPSSWH